MAPDRLSSRSPRSFALPSRKLRPIQGVLAALIAGPLAATFGTLIHQTRIEESPIGVGLALGMVFWIAITLRQRARKAAGWIFAGSLAVVLTIYSQPANDVMIPASEIGLAWTYGAIALAAITAAFPKIPAETWSRKL